ncbi:MAG TPA: tetratricopeptide repeat protein [Candidatus Acidoferrales bacterium]|nr:tetratricopeptide repeat protein [Candidatus Acidoferrales bacterium]
MKSLRSLFLVLLVAAFPALAHSEDGASQTLPVTTSSPAAARYFEAGMVHYENHRWNFALRDWNEAIHLDPDFALAYTWICFTTVDPAEETRDREKAKSLMSQVTPGEQLLIRWMAGVHENRYVDGISAMNDLLALYPLDKRLNFLVAYWLYRQDEYELAQKLTLRALAEDPKYATCYNQLAYLYSRTGDLDKAVEAAGKYVDLLPNQPNPHDSYAEMLRLSGRFQEALEQYHMALQIDPTFYISQKELGETYSLMGDEERARAEYAKAIEQAPSNGLKAEYLQKSALTYVREKKYAEADQAYRDAAEKAAAMSQWVWQARAYRILAMFQPARAAALKNLARAEALLAAQKGVVPRVDFDEEESRILRVRVERTALSNEGAARRALAQLEKMGNSGASINTQRSYHGAAGTLLIAQKKYAEAIPHLEEDIANPLSMKLLVAAYRKTGAAEQAEAMSKKLLNWKIPGIEEALAVSAFRTEEAVSAKN